ncbi:MAG: methylamine utilization protein MauG, partial [Pseudomonadota bacterium]
DVGRMAESDALEDAYRFRTPSLRNVALTGPYGHNGAFATLEGIVRHHLDPARSFAEWSPEDVDLPDAPWLNAIDFVALSDSRERARIAANIDIAPRALDDEAVSDLVAFLHALTGGDSVKGRLGAPKTVPSGLPLD